MSLTAIESLQKAIRDAILAAPAITATGITDVADTALPRAFPGITFGDWTGVPLNLDCLDAREISVDLHVWFREGSGRRSSVNRVGEILGTLLNNATLDLGDHALASLEVESWRTEGDPDGLTAHGILTLSGTVEVR